MRASRAPSAAADRRNAHEPALALEASPPATRVFSSPLPCSPRSTAIPRSRSWRTWRCRSGSNASARRLPEASHHDLGAALGRDGVLPGLRSSCGGCGSLLAGRRSRRLATRYHANRTCQDARASSRTAAPHHAADGSHPSRQPTEPVAHGAGGADRADCAVIVFAKAPEAGAVKTRLVPRLGAEAAAALHARLVERALATARAAAIGPVELACDPTRITRFFAIARALRRDAHSPGDGDLGTRMLAACNRALARGGRVLLIGADSPALTPAHLREAGGRVATAVGGRGAGGRRWLRVDRVTAAMAALRGHCLGRKRCDGRDPQSSGALGWNWHELATRGTGPSRGLRRLMARLLDARPARVEEVEV